MDNGVFCIQTNVMASQVHPQSKKDEMELKQIGPYG